MTGRKAKSLCRENLKRRRTPAMRVKLPLERWARGLAAAGLVIAALSPLTAWALPQGGTVSAGSATLTLPSSTSLRVAQSTDRLIMDWRSFNIWANESVRFQQPSAASIALNRVAGQEPSAIYGSLTANGQIFLVNPSGILFGSSSRVDVAGLTASTLNITNQDFLVARYNFIENAALTTLCPLAAQSRAASGSAPTAAPVPIRPSTSLSLPRKTQEATAATPVHAYATLRASTRLLTRMRSPAMSRARTERASPLTYPTPARCKPMAAWSR